MSGQVVADGEGLGLAPPPALGVGQFVEAVGGLVMIAVTEQLPSADTGSDRFRVTGVFPVGALAVCVVPLVVSVHWTV